MTSVISFENLKRMVPSVFTEEAADRTSDKYKHISTMKVIEGLVSEGFMPTWATQCKCRLSIKKAYTKHMLRFRHLDARPTSSGLYPEIVLINSHDGLSSYRLMAGVYRIVCANGLVAGPSYNEIRIRHQGDIVGEVIEGTYEVIKDSIKMIESAEKMSSIELNKYEQKLFAEAAHTVRFKDSEMGEKINPHTLLIPRRSAEWNKTDLFTVFNVVQENLIKGGVRGYTKNNYGFTKRLRTRAITGIDQSTALNRALWMLSEKMVELKSSHSIGAGDEDKSFITQLLNGN